jgi:hypothetical protein
MPVSWLDIKTVASEWLDLKTLKLLSSHTSAVAGAAFSFYIISRIVRWTAGEGRFSQGIEYGEKFVLAILLLWFTVEMGKLLWKGRVRIHDGAQILGLVA